MSSAGTVLRAHEPRPWPAAFAWLAGLTPFFFLSYGFANWVTSLRHDVHSLAFGWEHYIPFLPWTIVPYWSTDLFYAGALLLCRTRRELDTLGKRLVAVQVVCIAGFLLVPMQFTFERPHSDGLFGRMFDALMSFDRPFNQAPSLHVAITAVLWAAYSRHFRGPLLWLIRCWFVLMALSTLTTYQHHFIDIPTGLWVGLFAIALFREEAPKVAPPSQDPLRFLLAGAYFAGTLICALAAYGLGGAAWVWLWPAAALAAMGCIYWSGRPGLFRKSGGEIPPPVRAILQPYLACAWLNSRWYTGGQAPAQEIAAGIWLGRIPSRSERATFGFASLVDLTAELPVDSRGIAYRGIPMLDLLAPSAAEIEAAVQAIDDLESRRPTLVCCALGCSRSAACVAAWLVPSGHASSPAAAVEFIRARRPGIVLLAAHRAALAQWAGRKVRA